MSYIQIVVCKGVRLGFWFRMSFAESNIKNLSEDVGVGVVIITNHTITPYTCRFAIIITNFVIVDKSWRGVTQFLRSFSMRQPDGNRM